MVLVEKLGAGGMGHVWIAEHRALRTEVAVKLLWPCRELAPRELERFLREASAAARVKSPHVVTVFDTGVSELVGPYVVMELLEGEDLEQRLSRDEKLSCEEVSRIFSQISDAVLQAHESGLVHRDLKPANVFLVRGPNRAAFAKVLDFGIARDLDDPLTVSESIVIGTPGYMSPEQACGGEVTIASDLYSLGLVAFRALTGTHAISRSSREAFGVAAYKLELPRPSSRRFDLPAAFDAWFAKACAYSPEDRFENAHEQAMSLAQALAGEPGVAPDPLGPTLPEGAMQAKADAKNDARGESTKGKTTPEASVLSISKQVEDRGGFRWPLVLTAALVACGLAAWWGSRVFRDSSATATPAPSVEASRSADAAVQASEPLRFPLLVDLHGGNQKRGAAMLAAARAGATAINRQGGVEGRSVEIVPFDDEGDTGTFLMGKVTEAHKVANAHVAFGPTLSNQALLTAPEFAKVGLLQVSASASSTALANVTPTLFRLAPSDAGQAKALADLMKAEKCTMVTLVAGSGTYGKAFATELTKHVPGLQTVFVAPEATRNYGAAVREVSALGAPCVAFAVIAEVASRYLMEAARSGPKSRPMYFASDTLASEDFIELARGDRNDLSAPSVAEGVRGVRPIGANPDAPENRYFDKMYRELAGSPPTEPFLSMQFDAVVLTGIALAKAGTGASPLTLKAAMLEATRGTAPFGPQKLDELFRAQKRGVAIDYEAASGDIVFDGDERVGVFTAWKVERGRVVDTK